MNAKKKAFNNLSTNSSAANLPSLQQQSQQQTNSNAAVATVAASTTATATTTRPESTIDSCDKEKLENINKKSKKTTATFDMFADDDEFENGTQNFIAVNAIDKAKGAHLNDNWDDAEGYYSKINFSLHF